MKFRVSHFFIICCFLVIGGRTFAQNIYGETGIRVGVGDAQNEAALLAIPKPLGDGLNSILTEILNQGHESFLSDFNWYRKYYQVSKPEILSPVTKANYLSADYSAYSGKGYQYALHLKGNMIGNDRLTLSVVVHDIRNQKILGEESVEVSSANKQEKFHDLADRAYFLMNGKRSFFKSKIYFVSDYGSKANVKELFVMDFDGKNRRKLTSHNANVVGPAISHDGNLLAYTLIKVVGNRRTVDLFMMDLTTGKIKIVSNRPGINSGPVFTPDDKHLLLTMSFSGNAEIYKLNLENSKYYPLTKDLGDDVDPSVALSGDLYTFLSSRSGKAHVYTGNLVGTEKNIKRISFVGKFNATPRISPDGKNIVFASWVDERFDLYRIGAQDGRNLVRLTKDFGSNEDPDWSSDNEFIVFSSQRVISRREATQDLYLMDRDGEILGKITESFGKCSMPRFSR